VFPGLRERFDTADAAAIIAKAEADGKLVANLGDYHGQYGFAGRLTVPLAVVSEDDVMAWAEAHPDGLIGTYPETMPSGTVRSPVFVHAYRGRVGVIWNAGDAIAQGRGLLTGGK